MFMKILVTAAVVFVAWLVVRERWRSADDAEGTDGRNAGQHVGQQARDAGPLVPRGAVKLAAYGLVALMLTGTAVYLFQDWQREREIVQVRVVNAYTGKSEGYEARRGEIGERSFVTLDGRRVRIAEMERLILTGPDP
jgi:hypothetical protein